MKCDTNLQETEAEPSSARKEIEESIGKSWYDADQEHRQTSGRLSITRILFACLVSSNVKTNPKITDGKEEADATDTARIITEDDGRDNVASRLNEFMTETIQKDIDRKVRGGIALLSNSSKGTMSGRTDAPSIASPPACRPPPTAALGFVELSSSTNAEDFIVRLSKNDDLESVRILLCTDDCPCYEFAPSCPLFSIYRASPPHEEGEIDLQTEGPTAVVGEIMKNLCGSSASLFSKAQRRGENGARGGEGVIQTLAGEERKSLPSAARIAACARCSFYPTVQEYVEIFCTPIGHSAHFTHLESDRIFPALPVIEWDGLIREGMVPGLGHDSSGQVQQKNGLLDYDGRPTRVAVT